ncbi:efflux transporter outer membrane subunit [Bradyrhizobium pachyrhizi]|uniref:Efflux transporter outer membrane subunit n=1 Tax=Bradyrhizobium pachyrhizi TaxID=280333 RepID=A0A844SNF6_9BRAD|nr:efflux transporter outer membrane subunit [Bradyrhizobium pachyrhizi]MVT67296.1 efflux transporter outer membrane subunit [Bradyrhizobium pachyrhizi]
MSNVQHEVTRCTLVASLALSLTACAVGPDFIPPAAPITDKFLGANSRSIKSSHEDYRDWWRAFRDPTLNQLVQIAYNQNLTLLSAGTRVLQARATLGIAIGSFYPQAQQGTGSLIYTQPSAATPLALPNANPTQFWTDALAAQAAWELDVWGRFRRGVESADGAYLASIANYDDVLVALLGDIAATYIGIRTTEQLIAIARSNITKQEDALKIAKAKYTGGGASERDVFQATNILEQTRAAIPQLTIQLQQGEHALCVLLGIPPVSLAALLARSRGRIPAPPNTIAVGIPGDLLRRRPDVRAAELAALAQNAQIGVAEAQLYPAISITGTFGGAASTANGHNLGQIISSRGVTYAAGPSFQWNILNYGQITNDVRLQDAKLQQLLVDYQNTVLKAQQQVDDGISSFLQSRIQVGYLRRSAEAARGALKIGTEQYEQGATDFTTVLTAEQNLFQAETSVATASANVALGATAIYRALGGGWQIREDSYFVTAATASQMRTRTNWGELLPPGGNPQPPVPGLPSPADVGPTIRPPEW